MGTDPTPGDQPFTERILLGFTAGVVVGLITIILEISRSPWRPCYLAESFPST
jgi:hypothetical protein